MATACYALAVPFSPSDPDSVWNRDTDIALKQHKCAVVMLMLIFKKRHSSTILSNLKRYRFANCAKLERQAALADATVLLHSKRAPNFLQALDLTDLCNLSTLTL